MLAERKLLKTKLWISSNTSNLIIINYIKNIYITNIIIINQTKSEKCKGNS